MTTRPLRHTQTGMSLVEILVAMTISLILLGGVFQIFMSSKQTYRVQDGYARVQENGRFALEVLSRELRMAGYMGCGNLASINSNIIAKDDEALLFSAASALTGYVQNNATQGITGTDVLEVRRASESTVNLVDPKAMSAQAHIQNNPAGFSAGDILMVTDCKNADIFAATTVSSGGGKVNIAHASDLNSDNKLSSAYGTDAEMMAFQSTRYYVAETARESRPGLPIRAIYRRNLITNTSEELIEGVEYLRLSYGVSVNGEEPNYQSASAVEAAGTWARVISVRLAMLVASAEEARAPVERSYDLLGDEIEFDDGRVRRVFTTTVTLRNRAP